MTSRRFLLAAIAAAGLASCTSSQDADSVGDTPAPTVPITAAATCSTLVRSPSGAELATDYSLTSVQSDASNRIGLVLEADAGIDTTDTTTEGAVVLECQDQGTWYDIYLLNVSDVDAPSPSRQLREPNVILLGQQRPIPMTGWVTLPDDLSSAATLRLRAVVNNPQQDLRGVIYMDVEQ